MKNVSEWNQFLKTGSVEDYLVFRNQVKEETSMGESQKKENGSDSFKEPTKRSFYAGFCNGDGNYN